MMQVSVFLCLLVLGGTPAVAAPAAGATEHSVATDDLPAGGDTEPRSTLVALYPLWENTGHVLGHGRVHLGTASMDVGLLDVVQLGVRPTPFFFRTHNVHLKVRLLRRSHLSVAAHAEALVFLPGASESFRSSNYVSRVDTRDATLPVLPLGVTATWSPVPWLALHGTASVLTTLAGGPYRAGMTPGVTAVAEVLLHPHHSVSLHAGEVGFWVHDLSLLGASYRFRYSWFEAQAGYFFRLTPDGAQSSPLVSLGVHL